MRTLYEPQSSFQHPAASIALSERDTESGQEQIHSQGPRHNFSQMKVYGNRGIGYPGKGIIQTSLKVNQPGDRYEKEADEMAEKVMRTSAPRMNISPVSGVSGDRVQREEENTEGKKEEKKEEGKQKLQLQLPTPDFLSLRTPFFDRNVPHLWDPNSALGVWKYNFDFFKRFGLDSSFAGKAANLTAPLFINSQLKANNPTWWEVTDRELNTSSIMGSVPLFDFNSDMKKWKFLPFLQKKEMNVMRRRTLDPVNADLAGDNINNRLHTRRRSFSGQYEKFYGIPLQYRFQRCKNTRRPGSRYTF